jgi:TPR repeat protein
MTVSARSLFQWLRPAFPHSLAKPFERGLAAYERGQYLEAFKLWKLASQAGDAEANYRIGLLYAMNQGVAGSIPDAVVWYERAAQLGHVEAQFQLGLIFLYGAKAELGPNRPETWRVVRRSSGRQGIECTRPGVSAWDERGEGFRCRFSLDLGCG